MRGITIKMGGGGIHDISDIYFVFINLFCIYKFISIIYLFIYFLFIYIFFFFWGGGGGG